MLEERVIYVIFFAVVGFTSLAVGTAFFNLHKVCVQEEKGNRYKSINIMVGILFICLGISELLFLVSLLSGKRVFGWFGYGNTGITMFLAILILSILKKYPEPDNETHDDQN